MLKRHRVENPGSPHGDASRFLVISFAFRSLENEPRTKLDLTRIRSGQTVI